MGFKIKKPKISVPSISSVGRSINQVAINAGNAVADVKKSVDKSDVGKTVGAVATPVVNAATVAPRTVYGAATGTLEQQNQKTLGSLLSKFLGPASGVVATSSGAQKILNNPTVDKISGGLSADYAGASKGSYTLNKGYISQEDRDDVYRFGAKSGVIFAGAMTAAAYFGGSSETGAVLVESGTPLESGAVVTSSNVAAPAGVLASATQATPVAAAATTGGSSLSTYAGYLGAAGLGAKLLNGQVSPGQAVDILTGGGFNPDHPGTEPTKSPGILDSIGSYFTGGASDSGQSAVVSPAAAVVPLLAIGAIVFIAHKKRLI